ncbi:MAG: triose-phosphate isomerase [Alphaproteobacteria bacterium]|nr:triose-phosphate isomerase [Alphaproteobacteria bacterium]
MRRPLIAGNWKMNCLQADGRQLAQDVASYYKNQHNPAFDMLIAPPFTLLTACAQQVAGSGVLLSAQDCSPFDKGAHTGDVSPVMIKDLGAQTTILGHSERRTDHKETSAQVCEKAQAALAASLFVIICVGETLAQRENGQTLEVIAQQVQESLPQETTAENTVIAYEPVWAIGTGKTPTTAEVEEVHAFIREQIQKRFGAETADNIRILYGGSVKPSNAQELLSLPDVDGALIGGASLKAADFTAIAETVK